MSVLWCTCFPSQHPDLLVPRTVDVALFKQPHRLYDALKDSDAGIAGKASPPFAHTPRQPPSTPPTRLTHVSSVVLST
jgi:hypothetical protein